MQVRTFSELRVYSKVFPVPRASDFTVPNSRAPTSTIAAIVGLIMNDSKSNGHEGTREMPATRTLRERAAYYLKKYGLESLPDPPAEGSVSIPTRSDQIPDARLSPKGASSNRETDTRVGGLRLVSLGDLLAESSDESRWLVEGCLPIGGTSILGARPKVGKSTLARNLALSVARGMPFLDMAVQQGPVVYLALEEKRSEVQRHFQQMGAREEPIHIHFGIAPREELRAVREVIAQYKPALLIIDPLLRLVRVKDSNAYGEVTQALEPYVQLARSTGCHIMFVHHMVKHDRTGGEGLLGSTAIFGAVDTAIMLTRHEQVRTIETTQRYGEDLPPTVVLYDRSTGLLTRDRTITDTQRDTLTAKICAVLSHGPLNEAEIRAQLGGDQTELAKALRLLVEHGAVVRSGVGRKGSPYHYQPAGLTNPPTTMPSPREMPAQRSGDHTGWPTSIDELGPRVTGEFSPCAQCGEGTWSRYGDTPLCQADASEKVTKHTGNDAHATEEGGGGDELEQ